MNGQELGLYALLTEVKTAGPATANTIASANVNEILYLFALSIEDNSGASNDVEIRLTDGTNAVLLAKVTVPASDEENVVLPYVLPLYVASESYVRLLTVGASHTVKAVIARVAR